MKRVGLLIAYDGSAYCGWQIQPNGLAVQEVVERNLSELLNEEIRLFGASRTDTGVHALGNAAVFDTNSRIPGEKISYALNTRLPEDIKVRLSQEVPLSFHPRCSPSEKTYCYRILNARFPIPTLRLYTHFYHYDLDERRMERAGDLLLGEHDFRSFCAAGAQVKTTVRTLTGFCVRRCGEELRLFVRGNGFLYNMVRILAGTLIEIGNGQREPEEITEILKGKDRALAGPTAPARGLTLVSIRFENGLLTPPPAPWPRSETDPF